MKIPKKIQIAGKIIEIRIDAKECHKEKVYGRSVYDRNMIILDDVNKSGAEKQIMEQTFIHEILHFINAILNKSQDECDRDDYVNVLSEFLYQVIKQINT